MKTNRLTNIDALRGIAALAVCWFHMTNGYSEDSLVRASGHYGWLGVEVFFVISGFIIPYALYRGGYHAERDWKAFMWKRVLRIEPPYLMAFIMTLTLWYLSSMMPGFMGKAPNPSFLQIILHFGYLNGIFGYSWLNPVFWTLAIEFQFYLVVSVIFGLISHRRSTILYMVNFALLSLSLLIKPDIYVFHYLGLFLMGITAFQYRVGLITGVPMLFFMLSSMVSVYIVLGLMTALVGLATSVIILGKFNIGKKPLLMLGTISYSLYLVHVPIGGRVVNFGKRYIESDIGEAIVSVSGVLVSVAVAYIFYILIEKPSQVWASKYTYKK